MSCSRNRGSGSRHTRKVDPPHTSNCKSTCPGRNNGEKNCPYQKNQTSASTEEERCVSRCTQTQLTLISVTSCELPAGCPGPIIIQVPTDSNGTKADLRIEIYIHQSQLGQDELQKSVPVEVHASVVGSNHPEEADRSYGNRSSANRESKENETDQTNGTISDGGVASADTTEGGKLQNSIPSEDLSSPRRNSQRKHHRGSKENSSNELDSVVLPVNVSEGGESGNLTPSNKLGGSHRGSNVSRSSESRGIQPNGIVQPREDSKNGDDDATEAKAIENSGSSNTQEGSHRRSYGNRFTEGSGSLENEIDQPRIGLRNEESLISDNKERDKNKNSGPTGAATDENSDIQMSMDQNDEIVEENKAVEKAGNSEYAAAGSATGPESEVVSHNRRQGNISTDSEKDGIQMTNNISQKNMVDAYTQVECSLK